MILRKIKRLDDTCLEISDWLRQHEKLFPTHCAKDLLSQLPLASGPYDSLLRLLTQ
jgi:hypothetical protein